jgi:putative methionine-R-sulfoxide reductase with GAF domain
MKKQTEQKQWDLTKIEIRRLRDFQSSRVAMNEIISSLLEQRAKQLNKERDWWGAVLSKYGLQSDTALVADAYIGKIWVKGEVPELDKLTSYLKEG